MLHDADDHALNAGERIQEEWFDAPALMASDAASHARAVMAPKVKRLVLVTDAWAPQVNGVVTTLQTTVKTLHAMGVQVEVIEPSAFKHVPCPTYPEIRLAWRPAAQLDQRLRAFAPEAIHIATEGPLGMAARRWCMQHGKPFTTAYHTQFPEYLAARLPIPMRATYAWLRRFHGAATRTMVATPSMQRHLATRGFTHLVRWSRGVDTDRFTPRQGQLPNELPRELPRELPSELASLPKPLMVYCGRVAVEKNIEAFLKLTVPGTKVIIGDGPALASLRVQYPEAVFVGYRFGDDLARYLAAGDVFVFPSVTDTFGLVMLEAMACGLPVAAFPVTGPIDVVEQNVTGVLHEDLQLAIQGALSLSPAACREQALRYSWHAATRQFLDNLAPIVS